MEPVTSDFVRTLLARRGIANDDMIQQFLFPHYEAHTHDPFLLSGMDAAVARVLRAIDARERIAIYADFDCDGIPGAALLSHFFRRIGYPHVEVYIPHRDREGYGFHTEAIEALVRRGVSLIITVDVGTTACDACMCAHALGVDVIVTDHHELIDELPAAVAVLNPKRPPYPFPDLCGTAVAFKLVQAMLAEGRRRGIAPYTAIPSGWEKWLLDLVAIATVADMVPLLGENRVLVHFGLRVLRKTSRAGLRALAVIARFSLARASEDDIGFSIAPRINAASRMDEPEIAFRLLATDDEQEAIHLAEKLESLNASRKGMAGAIVREAKRRARNRFSPAQQVVVLGDTQWKPSLLGLAANAIVEERGGVVCLWGRDARGRLKGSCRSDGSLSIVALFAAAKDTFEECGGHAASGGFSVSHEMVHQLPQALTEAAERAERVPPQYPSHAHDAELTLADISWRLFEDISRMAPFGVGNQKPIFRIARAYIADMRAFGKERNHLELTLACRATGVRLRAFQFFSAPHDFTRAPEIGLQADVLATLERDTFRSPTALALRIVDVC